MKLGLFDHMQKNDRPERTYAGRKPHMGLIREIYVAETDKQAREEAREHWIYFWHRRGGRRTYGGSGQQNLATILDGDRKKELWDMERSIAEGAFICGSPETVTRQIQDIATQAGADTFLGEFTFGALEHSRVRNSLRLFVEGVAPALRNFEIDVLDYARAEPS